MVGESTIVRFNETPQNYTKTSGGNDVYNLTKLDEIQLVDITEIKYPHKGYTLIPRWRFKKIIKSTAQRMTIF